MKRLVAAAAVMIVGVSACSGGHTSKKTSAPATPGSTGGPPSATETTAETTAADSALILTMYDTINRAFQRSPDDGVRAIVAAQDPEDAADVNFKRCVNAIVPGAKTLPASKKYHFTPNITTTQPDAAYTVNSERVKRLHPKGRIYVTDVTTTDGTTPRVSPRHQVILNGKAYQFSVC